MPVTVDVETIGTFSKLPDKTTIPNGVPPRLNESNHLYGTLKEELDLKIGSEGFKDFDNGDGVDSLLDYILKTRKGGDSLEETINAGFITTPRILNAIARSTYNTTTPLEFQAVRHHDVVFLLDKSNSENTDTSISCLEKFKQYMTLDGNGNPHREHDPISNDLQTTRLVNRMTLRSGGDSNFKVIYASKVDAIDKNKHFVEIKTTTMGHNKWVEKQSIRHYLQSFLANVPYTVYGRRPNIQEQIVEKVDKIATNDIPKLCVNWNKETCFTQLLNVLKKVEMNLEFDETPIIVKVTKDGVSCKEADDNCELVDPLFLRHFE